MALVNTYPRATGDDDEITSAGFYGPGGEANVPGPGSIKDDSKRKFEDAIAIPLTFNQWFAIKKLIAKRTATPGTYDLRANNCTTWVVTVLKTLNLNKLKLNPDQRAIAGGMGMDSDLYTPTSIGKDLTPDPTGLTDAIKKEYGIIDFNGDIKAK